MIVAVLLGSSRDAGILYPKMFRPITLEFLAFLFTMVSLFTFFGYSLKTDSLIVYFTCILSGPILH